MSRLTARACSIWTHLFKDIEIIDHYRDPSTAYKGSAVRLGAGWQVADIYARLAEVGKVIVAGECAVGAPTRPRRRLLRGAGMLLME